jgi:hypothetical protein
MQKRQRYAYRHAVPCTQYLDQHRGRTRQRVGDCASRSFPSPLGRVSGRRQPCSRRATTSVAAGVAAAWRRDDRRGRRSDPYCVFGNLAHRRSISVDRIGVRTSDQSYGDQPQRRSANGLVCARSERLADSHARRFSPRPSQDRADITSGNLRILVLRRHPGRSFADPVEALLLRPMPYTRARTRSSSTQHQQLETDLQPRLRPGG